MPGSCFRPCRFSNVSVKPTKPPSSRNGAGQARCGPRRAAIGAARRSCRSGSATAYCVVVLGRTARRPRRRSAASTCCDQVAQAVAVHRVAEANLGVDLVALGDGHLAHVVADAGDLGRLRVVPRGGGAAPVANSSLHVARPANGRRPPCAASRIRLPMKPNSRSPWADWFRFMKSMSIVDQGMSRLNCVCRCSERLLQHPQPGDPHLGRRERVHPRDEADAVAAPSWPPGTTSRICSGVVSTGLKTTRTGICRPRREPSAISCEWRPTSRERLRRRTGAGCR